MITGPFKDGAGDCKARAHCRPSWSCRHCRVRPWGSRTPNRGPLHPLPPPVSVGQAARGAGSCSMGLWLCPLQPGWYFSDLKSASGSQGAPEAVRPELFLLVSTPPPPPRLLLTPLSLPLALLANLLWLPHCGPKAQQCKSLCPHLSLHLEPTPSQVGHWSHTHLIWPPTELHTP